MSEGACGRRALQQQETGQHGQILLQHRLADVQHVHTVLRQQGGHVGDDADMVFSDHGYDCTHRLSSLLTDRAELPSIYGAIREQMDRLEELGIGYETCPGVTACFGAAAALNLELTVPEVSQSLIITRVAGRTPVPEKESIESFASHHATMAVYLSAGHLKELSKRLMAGGYSEDTPAAIVYKATWPEQLCLKCTVSTLDEEAEKYGIKKTAVVLVGDAISPSDYALSCLYAPDFETEYRKKKTEEALALDRFMSRL